MPSRDEKYEQAKARTKAAADAETAEQERLRNQMEAGKTKPPARLSRADTARARRMDDSGDSVKPKKRFRR